MGLCDPKLPDMQPGVARIAAEPAEDLSGFRLAIDLQLSERIRIRDMGGAMFSSPPSIALSTDGIGVSVIKICILQPSHCA